MRTVAPSDSSAWVNGSAVVIMRPSSGVLISSVRRRTAGSAGRAGPLGVRPALPAAATGTDPESSTRSGAGPFDVL
ncbi:hypothetical protein GCM10010273_16650 [Streptomyces lavendulocolor]